MTVQHFGKTMIRLIALAFLLVSCAPAASIPPANTAAPSAIASPINRITPPPTNTSLPENTPTTAPTPVPWGHAIISPETASQVTQLTMWGRGTIYREALVAQNKNLAVTTSLGVYLYRLEDLTLLAFIEGATDFWVSPDGERLATGHLDASIKLWRASDGSLEQTLLYNIGRIAYPFSPEELETFPPEFLQAIQLMPVGSIAFSEDNHTLAAGYGDAHIGLWTIGQDTPKFILSSAYLSSSVENLSTTAEPMALSSDGKYLGVSGPNSLILWQSTNENPLWNKPAYGEGPVFSPDGSILAFIKRTYITRVILLESSSGEEIRQIDPEMDSAYPTSLVFSEDGKTLFITGKKLETNKTVRQTRNVTDNKIIEEIPVVEETLPLDALRVQGHVKLTGVAMLSNQEIQARVTGEQENFLWLLPSDQFTPFREPTALCANGILNVQYLDGTQYNIPVSDHPLCEGAVLVPGQDQALVWTANRLSLVSLPGGETVNLRGYQEKINSFAFGDNSRIMASGTVAPLKGASEIIIWQLDPLKEVGHTEKLDTGDMRIMLFSPDTTFLASAGEMLRLWVVPGGQLHKYIKSYASAMAFSPDGKILVSGDRIGTIHIWQVSNGAELATLKGHTSEVVGLAFTPDGTSLVSASDDGTVRIWGIQ